VSLQSVGRMLAPRTIAIVGASERNPFLPGLIDDNVAAGAEVHLVNPRRPEVLGRPTIGSLRDADAPVDCVMSMVSAADTIGVIEDAAAIGAGGVIVAAAQFGEVGGEGERRQDELRALATAADVAVCGPNCLGLLNFAKGIHLAMGPGLPTRVGTTAILAQSGGVWTSALWGAAERRLGLSHLISSGNEAVTDVVDFLEFLLDDPDTQSIGIVFEQIRRPAEFLALAKRALAVGKPIVACKLGRSILGQRVSASHTGALMQSAADYETVFRQYGIAAASDLDDLLDILQLFSHLPPDRWTTADRVAVLSASGGAAAVASDVLAEVGVELKEDDDVASFIRAHVDGATITNPLDYTGLNYSPEAFGRILRRYAESPAYDTFLVMAYLQEELREFAEAVTIPLREVAKETEKRLIAFTTARAAIGDWAAEDLVDEGIALGSGLRQTARSLAAMDRFVRMRTRTFAEPREVESAVELADEPVPVPDGLMMSFGDGMNLLRRFEIPVAPHRVLGESSPSAADIEAIAGEGERFVVKLADVQHRTEHGVVRTDVGRDDLRAAIMEMGRLAVENGFRSSVVVQPQLKVDREFFVGIEGSSVFGPMVLCGVGGIFVDLLGDVSARVAPLTIEDAHEMLDELAARKVIRGARGQAAVDIDGLAKILVAAGELAIAGTGWIRTLDINPLIFDGNGFAAADVSCVLRSRRTRDGSERDAH
jgi:acetate---CoA ligase (ADP-forming)